MKEIVSKIWYSPSARNVGKLLSANVVAQAIGLLVYPILTRMYLPEDFALLNLFISIASVVALFATLEYHYAIVLPKEDDKALSLVHLCFLIVAVVFVISCLTIPLASQIADLFNAPNLAHYWWMLPLLVLGMGIWNILNYWYIRCKAFMQISNYQISQSVLSATGKISFGALGCMNGGLIVASVLAFILSLFISIGLAWKKYLCMLLSRSDDVRTVAKEYANFPKFSLPRALVNSVGLSLPVWLLTPHFGLGKVGYLSLATMAAFVPLNIIARACYQVMYQKVSEKVQRQEPIQSIILRFIIFAIIIMMVGLAVIYIFVPQLVTFLFGADWIESAYIIRRLLPYLLLVPVCGTICFISDVFAKQKIAMWMEAGYVAMMALVLSSGIHMDNFETTISLYSWLGFGYLLVQLVWFVSLVFNYHKKL